MLHRTSPAIRTSFLIYSENRTLVWETPPAPTGHVGSADARRRLTIARLSDPRIARWSRTKRLECRNWSMQSAMQGRNSQSCSMVCTGQAIHVESKTQEETAASACG